MGTVLALNYPGLKGREKPELYEIRESWEASRNYYDLVPWDGPMQDLAKSKNKYKRRWFDTLGQC